MAQYEIKFIDARNAADQMDEVRQALEENADNLYKMSRYMQQGLEAETDSLASWSQVVQAYAEDTCRAQTCLRTVADNYYNAERLIYEQFLDTDSTLDDNITAEDSALISEKEETGKETISGCWKYRHRKAKAASASDSDPKPDSAVLAAQSDNAPTEKTPFDELAFQWENASTKNLPWDAQQQDWRNVAPILTGVAGTTGYSAKEIWDLIWNFLNKKTESTNESAVNKPIKDDNNDADDETITVPMEIAVGAGEIDRPEEQFSAVQSDVRAKTGRGVGAFGGGAAVDTAEENYSYWTTGYRASIEPDIKEDEDEPILVDPPAVAEAAVLAANLGAFAKNETFGPEFPGTLMSKTAVKSGNGVAAPLIGATSAASMAMSGLGLSNKLRGDKNGKDENDQSQSPAILAKEANGIFSGNLKGEYVILSSALLLIFSGISIVAGANMKSKKMKADERFKIGYGESAVLSGGAFQDRERLNQ